MRTLSWLLVIVAVACAPNGITAIPSNPWPITAPPNALALAVSDADGYVLGTVVRAEEAPTYDDICGVIMTVLGRCTETRAYRLTIRSAENFPPRLFVFVPHGDSLPLTVGTYAVFIWKMRWVKQLHVCAERMRRGIGNYCESDHLPTVTSRDAVASPGDAALVASLFAARRRP